MKQQVAKARHDLTISWEKFSNCQNINTLPEVCFRSFITCTWLLKILYNIAIVFIFSIFVIKSSVLDKLAFNLFTSRHHYHMLLSTYINSLREMNSVKKVQDSRTFISTVLSLIECHCFFFKISFVKTMVEHILAKYFFINFSYQV